MDEQEEKKEQIIVTDISKEIRTAYLNYAMSVIVSRALPDVRDGLKPVHRRILYGMYEMGLRANGQNKKSARIVGDVLGKYHPHGDASVYDALVRLGQDFSLRYPMVTPQGNFGSIDGDSAAAMRYTEARFSKIGESMLDDIQKDTVDFVPNYDESMKEPTVLPAAFPFLLANGSNGIAVGMATNMAPHNLQEICDAICAQIKNPDITLDELMQYIKGPDFPTGGIICGIQGIKDAFATGKGRVVIRSRYEIESHEKHDDIVFTEIPYAVNKADMVKRIDDMRKDGLFPGISAIRDESDRKGIRVVVELKPEAATNVVLNQLFRDTPLQSNFSINNLALVDGRPETLTLKKMLACYIKHRQEVVTRRTRFDLKKAQERAHILEGLKKGLDNIDEVVRIIKESQDDETSCNNLMAALNIDLIQAQAIIDMKLGRLSHLETEKILQELADLEGKIVYYKDLLSDESKILGVVSSETAALPAQLAPKDRRRTAIVLQELGDSKDEDFIKREDVVILVSDKGFAKRIPVAEYKVQARGGKGIRTARLIEKDNINHMLTCHSHDYVLYVTNYGKAYFTRAFDIPEASKTAKGTSIKNFLEIEGGESITNIISFHDFEEDGGKYLFMITKRGVAKKVVLDQFKNSKTHGVKAIILDEGDELLATELIQDGDEVMAITKNGRGLRFNADEVRAMGRATHGVRGMNLASDDEIAGLLKVDGERQILMVTSNGKGKRVRYSDFMAHSRGTMGQKIYRLDDDNIIIGAQSVNDENDVVCVTSKAQTIRVHVKDISLQGRNAAGVNVVRMKTSSDKVIAMALTDYDDGEDEEGEDDSVHQDSQLQNYDVIEAGSTESQILQQEQEESETSSEGDGSPEDAS